MELGMDIKNKNRIGYKETKVGWIPDDWECYRLEEVASVITGPFGSQLHESDYVNDGTPIITVEHLGESGLLHQNLPLVSDVDKDRLSRYILEKGDIVFSRVGSVDRNSLVSNQEEGWLCSGRLLRIRPHRKHVYSLYLNSFFHQHSFKNHMRSIAVGGTMACLNTGLLARVFINLPPLPEQEAIAGVLECWDKAIRNYEKKIENKRNIKKGLIQKLILGKQRLPGFLGEWKEIQLRDVLAQKPKYGINAAAVPYAEDLPTYLRITDISEYGRFFSDGAVSVNNIRFEEYYLNSGDLVFARTGASTGKTYLYNPNDGRLVFAGFLIKVTPDPSRLLPQFLKFYTETDAYWKWVSVMCMRSGQPGINGNEYAKLDLRLPSVPEQQAIASILSAADSEIEAMEKKLMNLKDQKKFLLNNLVTGTIRLPQFRGGTASNSTDGENT